MKEIVHFNNQRERLAYLKGGFEEIVPVEAVIEDEKPKKSAKKGKKGKKKDEIQAE